MSIYGLAHVVPCIVDFKKLPELKKKLANENIEYLYMARETSHPNSFQLWKNAIRKYHIEGWHVYMSKELENNVWASVMKNSPDVQYPGYPHYLIVDRTEFVSYDAEGPGEEVVRRLSSVAGMTR